MGKVAVVGIALVLWAAPLRAQVCSLQDALIVSRDSLASLVARVDSVAMSQAAMTDSTLMRLDSLHALILGAQVEQTPCDSLLSLIEGYEAPRSTSWDHIARWAPLAISVATLITVLVLRKDVKKIGIPACTTTAGYGKCDDDDDDDHEGA